jgi:putative phosphoribosyl transferase
MAKGQMTVSRQGLFQDRADAGRQLAEALAHYRDRDAQVLAIPRGGVEVGYHVAQGLDADLSIIISRKLPFPDNPEAGFGAVAEDGSLDLDQEAAGWLDRSTVQQIIRDQEQEVRRRISVLRGGRPLPPIADRTVILVDDGIAMGSTMRASVSLCRHQKAGRIVIAAPVSGAPTAREFESLADEAVILTTPHFFRAVAQAYENWYDVSDEEVIAILKKWHRQG